MALITCPECGKKTDTDAIECPYCGYPIKNAKKETTVNLCHECGEEIKKGEMVEHNCGYDSKSQGNSGNIKIVSIVIACLCLILAVTRINNDKYNFYKQHYKECVAGYEENSRSASNSGGLFKGTYIFISNSYKGMADSDMKKIWKYRIQAILFASTGVVILVVGKKIAKKKEE